MRASIDGNKKGSETILNKYIVCVEHWICRKKYLWLIFGRINDNFALLCAIVCVTDKRDNFDIEIEKFLSLKITYSLASLNSQYDYHVACTILW